MDKFRSNVAFSFIPHVKEICAPLFANTKISFFQFMKTFDDGSYMTLTHNGYWLENYFSRKYYEISNFRKPAHTYKEQYLLTSAFNGGKQIAQNATEAYDIANCITLVEREKNACEFYLFAAGKKHSDILEFYLNNMQFLKLFIFYFKDKAKDLLQKHHHEKFLLTKPVNQSSNLNSRIKLDVSVNLAGKINRYYLGGKHAGRYLTKRELACVYWLSKGKSASEIGIILEMAPRTAEIHLYNIKQKLNCVKLTQIITELTQYGLIDPSIPG